MKLTEQIANHIREVHFGQNWTWVNMKDSLADVDWQLAITQVYNFNTIAALVFHANYYVDAVLKVLEGKPLDSKDTDSFNLPPIHSQADWEQLLSKTWDDTEKLASMVQQLPES